MLNNIKKDKNKIIRSVKLFDKFRDIKLWTNEKLSENELEQYKVINNKIYKYINKNKFNKFFLKKLPGSEDNSC